MPVFFDANCFKAYLDGLISGQHGACYAAFNHIGTRDVIVLDDGGIFVQEWKDCCGGPGNIFANDHIADLLAQGKIALVAFTPSLSLRKTLKHLGVPKKDAKIVEFSAGAGVTVLASNDIDLYESTKKGCKSSLHHKYVHNRKGSVCRYIEKKVGIVICCCCNVPQYV